MYRFEEDFFSLEKLQKYTKMETEGEVDWQ